MVRSRRAVLAAAATVGTAGLAGCSALGDDYDATLTPPQSTRGEWPLPRHGPANTAVAPTQSAPGLDAVTDSWRLDGLASPVVANGRVFAVDTARGPPTVVAHDARTGARDWRFPFASSDSEGTVSVVVHGDVVLASAGYDRSHSDDPRPNQLVALDAATGEGRWRATGDTLRVLTAARGLALAIDGPGIRVFDTGTGAEYGTLYANRSDLGGLFSPPRANPVGRPALAGGTAFVSLRDPADRGDEERRYALAAVDLATGTERWRTDWDGPVSRPPFAPVVADGRVLVPHGRGLRAYDARSGALHWRTPLDIAAGWTTAPAVADGTAVTFAPHFADRQVGYYALDIATGDRVWHRPDLWGRPVGAGDTAYAVSVDADGAHALVSFDPTTGETRATRAFDTAISPPVIADGVFVPTEPGLRALA